MQIYDINIIHEAQKYTKQYFILVFVYCVYVLCLCILFVRMLVCMLHI